MRKLLKSTRGVAAVEFALIAPLLFVLLFGIIEFSMALYNKAVITNASREGARFAAGFYTNPLTATAARPTCGDIQTYVTNYVNLYLISFKGDTFNSSNVTCPNGTPSLNFAGSVGYADTIRINYTYTFLALGNLVGLMTGGTFAPSLNLSAQTVMRDENQQGP
jgi:Flp pilus assembly protein TadG